jgi:hypothetical protein
MKFRMSNVSIDDLPNMDELFESVSGKKFGEQINQILEFVTKGNLLTMISSVVGFVEGMLQVLSSGNFSQMIEKLDKKPPPEDVQLLSDLESLASRVDGMNLKEGLESLPGAEDRSWYFSLIIFALYTYLDVYTRSLIDLISTNEILSTKLEAYLATIAEKRPDKSRLPILDVEEMKRFGIGRRLDTIERGLSIDPILEQVVGKVDMNIFRKGTAKFIEIRGKAAHSNPRLNHEDYTFEELENDIDEIEVDFSEFDGFIDKIGFYQYGLPQVKEATLELGGVLRKIRLILLMAIVYPALIDVVLQSTMDLFH